MKLGCSFPITTNKSDYLDQFHSVQEFKDGYFMNLKLRRILALICGEFIAESLQRTLRADEIEGRKASQICSL